MTTLDSSITVAKCRDDHWWVIEDVGDDCPHCQSKWTHAEFTTRSALERKMGATAAPFQLNTFKPYSEEGFTGEAIPVESKGQREALCREHGLSYDGCTEASAPYVAPAIDSITPGDLKAALADPDFLTKDEDTVRDDCEPDIPEAPEETNDQ